MYISNLGHRRLNGHMLAVSRSLEMQAGGPYCHGLQQNDHVIPENKSMPPVFVYNVQTTANVKWGCSLGSSLIIFFPFFIIISWSNSLSKLITDCRYL